MEEEEEEMEIVEGNDVRILSACGCEHLQCQHPNHHRLFCEYLRGWIHLEVSWIDLEVLVPAIESVVNMSTMI